ncbi:MAG: 50S ribosomal protein L3 [Candidatus Micrarchaeota archaeon]|nr:50S ribosomal protein L3 [Candidatus Micrarchaeota archaeon]
MGKHAPGRGSIAARPRKRAASLVPRMRCWPTTGKGLLGFAGYKVGMAHVVMTDDSESPTKGQEITKPVTFVEVPPLFVYSIVAYGADHAGCLKIIGESIAAGAPKELSRTVTLTKKAGDAKKIEGLLGQAREIRVKACALPAKTGFGKKAPELFEVGVAGATPAEQFEYAKSVLGKEVPVSQVLAEGEYVDVVAVTTGRGWQGIVKRFGVALNPRKATKSRRHGGSIGAERQAKVFYTIPRAGQTGFHRRTDRNKRVMKIVEAKEAARPGAFAWYGVPRSECIIMEGSVPGPAKRFLKLRKSLSGRAVRKPVLKEIVW